MLVDLKISKMGLVKKLLAPIILSAALILPSVSAAQTKSDEAPSRDIQISLGAGLFNWNESYIEYCYNSDILTYRGGATIGLTPNVRLFAGAGYFNQSGDLDRLKGDSFGTLMGGSSSIEAKTFEAQLQYVIKTPQLNIFAGAGYSSTSLHEIVNMDILDWDGMYSFNYDESRSASSPVFSVGVELPFGKDGRNMLYGQYSTRKAEVDDGLGGTVDSGGSILEAGIRFKL